MKVMIEYIYPESVAKFKGQNGHHYIKKFETTSYYCPICGENQVYVCSDGGDYYQGESYHCINCEAVSYLDHTSKEPLYEGLIEQLKSGIIKEPSTPKGN